MPDTQSNLVVFKMTSAPETKGDNEAGFFEIIIFGQLNALCPFLKNRKSRKAVVGSCLVTTNPG